MWTKRGPGTPARGGSGAPRRGLGGQGRPPLAAPDKRARPATAL
jgi:hypothetical protein